MAVKMNGELWLGRNAGPFVVLCVGGTDSAGCSGLAADLRTVAALGGHGALAVTAVTAQDTRGVRAVTPIASRIVLEQISTVLRDPGADAVKIGMLARAPIVRAVASALAEREVTRVVLDPVLRSTTGGSLLDAAGRRALLERLLPRVDLITPNLPETQELLGCRVRGIHGMVAAARSLLGLGVRAVLVKGGHLRGRAVDVYADASGARELSAPRIPTADTRGTGCVLATACACFLARGIAIPEAVVRAKSFVAAAIRRSYSLGSGRGPVNPLAVGAAGPAGVAR